MRRFRDTTLSFSKTDTSFNSAAFIFKIILALHLIVTVNFFPNLLLKAKLVRLNLIENMEDGGRRKNGVVCSSETANGGEDVYSCKESDQSSADHLVIMVHGILGRYSL